MKIIWKIVLGFIALSFAILLVAMLVSYIGYHRDLERIKSLPKPKFSYELSMQTGLGVKKKKRVRVLVLSGRLKDVYNQMRLLAQLEKASGKPTSSLFDFFVCSGFSCLSTAALLLPSEEDPALPKYSAAQVLEWLPKVRASLYHFYFFRKILTVGGWLGSMYSNKMKSRYLESLFGQIRYGELLKPMEINVFSIDTTKEYPMYSWGKSAGCPLTDLVSAGFSTPVLFTPQQVCSAKGTYASIGNYLTATSPRLLMSLINSYPGHHFVVVEMPILPYFSYPKHEKWGLIQWISNFALWKMTASVQHYYGQIVLDIYSGLESAVKVYRLVDRVPHHNFLRCGLTGAAINKNKWDCKLAMSVKEKDIDALKLSHILLERQK